MYLGGIEENIIGVGKSERGLFNQARCLRARNSYQVIFADRRINLKFGCATISTVKL